MSTWVSAAPMIGAGSLDGFAIGALMTGACALAVTAPRRTRGRKTPSARDGALAAEERGWLCEHVMAAETGWAEVAAEAAVAGGSPALAAASGPASAATSPGLVSASTSPGPTDAANAPRLPSGTIRTALPSGTVVPELVAAAMVPGLVAEAVASALGAEAFEASAERLARYEEFCASRRGAAKIAGSYRSRHRLGDSVPGSEPSDGAELVFADPQPSGRTQGSPKRTEARCMPRHAAPSVGFGGRLTGVGSRMTGLFADRALVTGARG